MEIQRHISTWWRKIELFFCIAILFAMVLIVDSPNVRVLRCLKQATEGSELGQKHQDVMTNVCPYVRRKDFFSPRLSVKVIELILSLLCVALSSDLEVLITILSHKTKITEIYIICTTYGGYLLITIVTLVCRIAKKPLPPMADLLFSCTGAVLFFAAGGITVTTWMKAEAEYTGEHKVDEHATLAHASGIVALITGVVFVLDGVITWRKVYLLESNEQGN